MFKELHMVSHTAKCCSFYTFSPHEQYNSMDSNVGVFAVGKTGGGTGKLRALISGESFIPSKISEST